MIPHATKIAPTIIKARIWLQLKQHSQIEWEIQTRKVVIGNKTEHDARFDFKFDFDEGGNVFRIVEAKLSFDLLPPEPD